MSIKLLKSAARKVFYVLATGVVLVAIAWWAAQPSKPDAFYDAPAERPTEPGALLRNRCIHKRNTGRNARMAHSLHDKTRRQFTCNCERHCGCPRTARA